MLIVIGLGSIYAGINILLNIETSISKGFILTKYDNILIKYGSTLTFIFCGIGVLTYTLLILKGKILLRFDLQEATKLEREQSNLLSLSTFLPGGVFFVSTGYYSGVLFENSIVLIVIFFFILEYVKCIYGVLKFKKTT